MKILERRFNLIDKNGFPPGKWMYEPDMIRLIDEYTLTPGLILRSRMGNLCGYIGFTEPSPYYGLDDNKEYDLNLPVEITYTGFYPEISPYIWWLGWDYAHLGDYVPGMDGLSSLGRSQLRSRYKNTRYANQDLKMVMNTIYPTRRVNQMKIL